MPPARLFTALALVPGCWIATAEDLRGDRTHGPDPDETGSPVTDSDLPNPGSGAEITSLRNGHWALISNETARGRNSLAVQISDDEGKTWKWNRHLEKEKSGSYHYPSVIQAGDGTIHVVYSYFVKGGQSMKHAAFNEAWVQAE